jgi:uncharacterized repeat protein (TIGR01451 family)
VPVTTNETLARGVHETHGAREIAGRSTTCRDRWRLAVPLAVIGALGSYARGADVAAPPHLLRAPDATVAAPSCPATIANLNDGPVMTSFTAYLIFWLPPGFHFSNGANPATAASDADYEHLIIRYFQDVGDSPFSNILGQYPGSNGFPSPAVTLGNVIADDDPYPRTGDQIDPLLDADIRTEIANIVGGLSLPIDLNAMYFVYTASGIQVCTDSTPRFCTFGPDQSRYCSYHSSFRYLSLPVVYAAMPDDYSLSCAKDFAPNGNTSADVEISTTSHEQFEATTDPLDNAWGGGSVCEIADRCAYVFGPGIPAIDTTSPNIFLNGHPYRLQQEWNAAAGSCTLSRCGASVCSATMRASMSASPSIAGKPGDTIAYAIRLQNSSAVDPATFVSVTDILPPNTTWLSGRQPDSIVGNVLTFFLPNVNVQESYTLIFSAQLTARVAANTVLSNTATLAYSNSLGISQPSVQIAGTTRTATTSGTCVGDCNGDARVTVNEIVQLVNAVLGNASPAACFHGVPAGSQVDVALVIKAVNNVLVGCGH